MKFQTLRGRKWRKKTVFVIQVETAIEKGIQMRLKVLRGGVGELERRAAVEMEWLPAETQ